MDFIKKNTLLIGIINFLTEFRLYGVIAILYFTEVTGSMILGMSIFSAAMLSTAVFELPTGILSDTIGRKKTIVLGTFSALVSIVFYAFGGNIFNLLTGAFFEGLSIALFSGNNDAFLFNLLKSENKEDAYKTYLGKTRAMSHLALSIAAVFGGVLLYFSSYAFILWLSVIPKALCIVFSMFLNEPKAVTEREKINPYQHFIEVLHEIRSNKKLLKIVVAESLSLGAGEASYQFRATFLKMVWPIWAIGLAGTLGDAGATLSFWISGKWIKRSGYQGIIIYGKIYSLLVSITAFLMKNVLSPILLTTTSLFYGVTSVAKNDLSQQLYSDKHRASMGSFQSFVGSLAYAVLAIVIGWVADSFGVVMALLSFQMFNAAALMIYLNLFKKEKAR